MISFTTIDLYIPVLYIEPTRKERAREYWDYPEPEVRRTKSFSHTQLFTDSHTILGVTGKALIIEKA